MESKNNKINIPDVSFFYIYDPELLKIDTPNIDRMEERDKITVLI